MENVGQNQSWHLLGLYCCPQLGVDKQLRWNVRGFYAQKFDDPWNFNLNDNMVSLITATTISFSIILFADILFRVLVRAKNGRLSPEVVQRRRVLENFSDPISLLSTVFRGIKTYCSELSENNGTVNNSRGLSRWTYSHLAVMGSLIVLVEFLFIFLATNQNRVYDLRLDAVPIFEFEDRGCELLHPPATINGCDQVPLTDRSGFDSRASLQICTTNTIHLSTPASGLSQSSQFLLSFSVQNIQNVQVSVIDMNRTVTQNTRIGIHVEQNGKFYVGVQNVGAEQLLSALTNRFKRTNITVRVNVTTDSIARPEEVDDIMQRQLRSEIGLQRHSITAVGAAFLVDATNISLQETHLSHLISGAKNDVWDQLAMHGYFHDIMRSTMFPTGKGRGVLVLGDDNIFLDEDSTPLVYYNRPWLGVVPSLIIGFILLLIWTVLAALGIGSHIDSRLAWQTFFKDIEITNVDSSERGGYESQLYVPESSMN